MMAQQACFCGGISGFIYYLESTGQVPPGEAVAVLSMVGITLAGGYWYVMGAMMTGEWPHLSRRVQRSLPQSTLGRAFLSLFNPGPGAGYLFAVANLSALALAGLMAVAVRGPSPTRFISTETVVFYVILTWAYVVAFLGFGRLFINVLRRWVYVPMAAAFLLHVIVLLVAIGAPTIIQMTSRELRYQGYSLLQMSNPVWTLEELMTRGVGAVSGEILILLIPAAAIVALLLNMRSVATELLHHRIAVPIRVAEEEAVLHPPPEPKPSNPWEVEEAEAASQE
jgi:hypothetical protein